MNATVELQSLAASQWSKVEKNAKDFEKARFATFYYKKIVFIVQNL